MPVEAQAAKQVDDHFVVTLNDGCSFTGSRIVLATGVRDELPALPGLEERWGASVLHYPYCHGYEVTDKKLGVLATNAWSIDQALLIPDWGPTTFFTQGVIEENAEEAAPLKARNVKIERSPMVEVLGDTPELTGLRLADDRIVAIDSPFVGPRTHMTSSLAQQLGCAFDEGPIGPAIRVNELKQTSVSGVFAAGDAATALANASFAAAAGVAGGVAAHRSLIFGI